MVYKPLNYYNIFNIYKNSLGGGILSCFFGLLFGCMAKSKRGKKNKREGKTKKQNIPGESKPGGRGLFL